MYLFLAILFLASSLEAQGCNIMKVPKNGAIARYGDMLIPLCQNGFYPNRTWFKSALIFVCRNNEWVDVIGQVKLRELSGCTETKAPVGVDNSSFHYYHFMAKCKTKKAANEIRERYIQFGLCSANSKCTKDKIEVRMNC